MTVWIGLDPRFTPRSLGMLVEILQADDPRSIKEQLEDRYAHGGGWRPIKGFTMRQNNVLHYPGDQPFKPVAKTEINGEIVIFYPKCSLLAVVAQDGTFAVTRVD